MIKTHQKTGLKYLCHSKQTDQNRYKGSGTDWREHLKEFGRNITTEIVLSCSSKKELSYWGRYYSNLWKITTAMDDFGNKIWANRIPETGSGGGRISGTKLSRKTKNKLRKKATGRKQSLETCQKRSVSMFERFKNVEQWNKGIKFTDIYSDEERQKKFGQPGTKNPMYGVEVPREQCPHCNKIVDIRNYSRYHGDKCKLRL
jgi:hypothetical protein